jgi:hypothetical protein
VTPERWQKVEQVLQAALDLPAAERGALLSQACRGDDALRREALSLIEAHESAGEFIEEAALAQDAYVILGRDQFASDRRIGPYRIVERLGRGGMGEVFLADDSRLDRQVALKILPPYFVSNEERLRRFQIEARAASALNHSNILTIYEVGQSEDVHFIATEFIEGETIRELIDAGNLSLGEVVDISVQMLSGLAAAHAGGIVHRDIKPENLMRRRDGVVRILDFGIAKLVEAPPAETFTEVGALLGTVAYVSPEQVRGRAVDERTDIWSCGVVLYEMLTSIKPFAGDTNADIIVAILERQPPPLFAANGKSGALRLLQSIIDKALRKEADERYQTAAEMLDDLTEVKRKLEAKKTGKSSAIDAATAVRDVAVLAHRDSISRRRRMIIASCAVLAVMLLFVAWVYRRSLVNTNTPAVAVSKTYAQMSEAEQINFVDEQEQRISAMMGDRPVKLNDEALRAIKAHVDRYASRKEGTAEPLPVVYGRATPYIPVIAREFSARRIPIVVGIYLPMIESAYRPCYENSAGAKGLFQFLPQTAERYGVARADMCDVNKMAPAAAHYIADRMAELGDDSQSMTLVLLSYNRGEDAVREALRRLRDTDAKSERNFWTLFANRDKLGDLITNENSSYVPEFFAAAIVGENPEVFELKTARLSTLAETNSMSSP